VVRRPLKLLFVDDSLRNVEAARAAGMAAIHFRPGVDLQSELKAHRALP
jgi:putative hydrolase of the HAD superfamily